jgi:hypothetical protein
VWGLNEEGWTGSTGNGGPISTPSRSRLKSNSVVRLRLTPLIVCNEHTGGWLSCHTLNFAGQGEKGPRTGSEATRRAGERSCKTSGFRTLHRYSSVVAVPELWPARQPAAVGLNFKLSCLCRPCWRTGCSRRSQDLPPEDGV